MTFEPWFPTMAFFWGGEAVQRLFEILVSNPRSQEIALLHVPLLGSCVSIVTVDGAYSHVPDVSPKRVRFIFHLS